MLGKGIKKSWGWLGLTVLLLGSPCGWAAEFSASFKGTDIQEFINTVSKNLNKTVIIDPTVRGTISVRSYDMMNEGQYYQFFLSVLDVYGFSVVPMDNGVLKVIRSKDAKSSSIPLANNEQPGIGDELVTRVVPLNNVAARDLAPLLRQLNDNAGAGTVVHYEPSNVLLMTGRAAVIKRLVDIVNTVDKTGDREMVTVPLTYASAEDVAKLVNDLNKSDEKNALPSTMLANVVADGRTNSVVVSGEENARQRAVEMIRQLDRKQVVQGGTKVIYLKYAKALDLIEVLAGNGTSGNRNSSSSNASRPSSPRSGSSSNSNSSSGSSGSSSGSSSSSSSSSSMGFGSAFGSTSSSGGRTITIQGKEVTVRAHDQTNSLIITAPPDIMRDLEQVINQLDIRRPQVLVEAIIAEIQDADGLNLGIQWANKRAGMTQFTNTGIPISTAVIGTDQFRSNGTLTTAYASALSSFNGVTAGFYRGNWSMLLTALSSDSKNDVLATPSIVTLDNMEATFNVGQEVPVLTGSQTTSADNIFNTVERKTVGIKLRVKPQINEGDSVLLQIEQEVSSVADSNSSTNSSLGVTFNTRTVNNAVMVTNGETVVVGGLLDKTSVESNDKVPLLGDIPWLGSLFRSKSQEVRKRNLMLFLRPTIIRDPGQFQEASINKYRSFNNEQQQQRGEGNGVLDNNTLRLSGGNTYTFRQVQSSISDFYKPEGR
ncbi:type II secretion system secretin GspD [Dickeya dadantii]|uniref:Secretin OutD n=1 Tax=Dickeya dadantii (strain 3937) TaxID=198628 RepID=GSPD2_DICD3|nr:type II secretion system secretin GspD [Dickeya dadantii]Q01565.1 RecName: Full=Secretin OutD; AltName: Full=General secretion pathway protein D; AltName: Full=Pectic enzymes secretion protein OutD; AltName: Full=Type II secretion system protein D; Short=T2SS protein D; Flags: Precursor [Dickeya dadantii 3937]CAA46370.1 outD [Dickeya chrysanthemi]ADM99376.1 General secretion pathway protein D [Dickeya dadantii 3937]NAT76671.1 type II secretion system protein GspD [Dickeya dadantii]NPE62528.